MLEVRVPNQATVYVGGIKSKSTGPLRRYAVNRLTPDRPTDIEVRVEIASSGNWIQQTRTVRMRAGRSSSVSFDFDNPETSLILNVPRDAEVELAGIATTGTGPRRTFRTTGLVAGQELADYGIRVSVERNGQQFSKEQSISLKSGESRVLTFDFEEVLSSQEALAVRNSMLEGAQ